MKKRINVALIGHKFMGKAHSNAIRQVGHIFPMDIEPEMKILCGAGDDLESTAELFGWQQTEKDWHKVVTNPEIDCVSICTPGGLHAEIAIEAAKNKKHIICEKPLANTKEQAEMMAAAVKEASVINFVNFNYRRVPAIILAKKLIDEGKLGNVLHIRAIYQQDWAAYEVGNYVWRFDNSVSGGGAISDKASHIIDLARYLVGEFIDVVSMDKVFIPFKIDPVTGEKKAVTSDDAAFFMANFDNGAMGIFQTSRVSIGKKNWLALEINGTKGSLCFNLERMNELEVYIKDENTEIEGFRTVMITNPEYMYIKNWWPAGHVIGWEHTFIHQYYEFFTAIATGKQIPTTFEDGLKVQKIISSLVESGKNRQWVKIN